ncbi:MAG: enoyl-CoA hydratase/isomerase family protein [Nitratireductor sp.]|nr:enoyl-CoA hydratase/isomerase family protein [Nitratireductor sp.]
MSIRIEKQGQAMIVRLDNPPVNAIGHAMRLGLRDVLDQLDGGVDRVVVTGAGSAFAAGADAREFDAPPAEPHLPDVIAALEQCPVPWIAAINGVALGGGAEIVLGCGYRIAAPGAQIGLPEVTLGVIPGAGGTQRLPRLVGMKAALDIIPQGKALKADEALAVGLIDQIADDPLQAALALDLAIVSDRPAVSAMPAPGRDDEAIAAARDAANRKMRMQTAPQRAIDLVALSAELPFDDAMQQERAAFLELRQLDQARALRHAFFAERGAKAPASLKDVAPVDVRSAIVVGGGTMGAGIAYALDRAGIAVTIVENDQGAVERAGVNIARLAEAAEKRGLMSAAQSAEVKQRIAVVEGYGALPAADLAIEAVFEEMAVKHAVFSALEKALPAHAVLATNTSYLDVNRIAAVLSAPSRLVGLHFFAPAHIMKLLEIVEGEATSDVALATGFALAKRLKKIPVLAGVCDGFIGNRILTRYREQADMLLLDGATPWEVDEAMAAFGYAMGPYETQDLSGLDIAYANRKRKAETRDPARRYIAIQDRMVEQGRLGRKTGVGWYRYPGGGGKVVDPLIEDLIREEAHFAKVARREFSAGEIRERLLAAMINEAAAILDEGIAAAAADIDLVTLHGYGFPRWRGGLMHYADTVGAGAIHERLQRYRKEDPVVWRISPLIERLAESGGRFADVKPAE